MIEIDYRFSKVDVNVAYRYLYRDLEMNTACNQLSNYDQ